MFNLTLTIQRELTILKDKTINAGVAIGVSVYRQAELDRVRNHMFSYLFHFVCGYFFPLPL